MKSTSPIWLTLFTAMFLHGGLIHIGFNMMALMQFGPAIEELYGSARYLFIYVFTGAFGFLASAFTGHFSLGASGALLGLVGVMLAVTSKRGGAYMRDLRSRLISSVVILFVLGFSGFMAMGIVDRFQIVQVQIDDQCRPFALDHSQVLLSQGHKSAAVVKAGQIVGRRHPVQLLAASLGLEELPDEVLVDHEYKSE